MAWRRQDCRSSFPGVLAAYNDLMTILARSADVHSDPAVPNASRLVDRFGRHVNYVRLSVTDRCDFRCVYCMGEEMIFLPRAKILTLEEMAELGRAFVELGVRKIRITGGEPLVRKNVLWLLQELGQSARPEGTGADHQRFAIGETGARPQGSRGQAHQYQPGQPASGAFPADHPGGRSGQSVARHPRGASGGFRAAQAERGDPEKPQSR